MILIRDPFFFAAAVTLFLLVLLRVNTKAVKCETKTESGLSSVMSNAPDVTVATERFNSPVELDEAVATSPT